MRRRELWALVLAIVLIGAVWIIHSSLDTAIDPDTAPVQRSDDQNTNTNAPNEQVAPAGTEGVPNPPASTD
ncbi:hypothetical protein [Tianweitania sediminis]|jgi:hypothetical protein|uniref:Uncharacterized protein n=1 Tax=Tianweitania sediminis TaxID=1502156 RepID=A0A8J7R176_9HYPH|nr:hypothetical protein [Tianweitania sediminis]MBP0440225.1 hypothetical protein [Tianweitania sediminis]HEV7417115.1 hypothetical protein [Tianweitania sediminis]